MEKKDENVLICLIVNQVHSYNHSHRPTHSQNKRFANFARPGELGENCSIELSFSGSPHRPIKKLKYLIQNPHWSRTGQMFNPGCCGPYPNKPNKKKNLGLSLVKDRCLTLDVLAPYPKVQCIISGDIWPGPTNNKENRLLKMNKINNRNRSIQWGDR